jgi:hypothetical protein
VPIKNEKREVVLFLASHKELHPPREKSFSVSGKPVSVFTTNAKGFSNSLTVPGFDITSDEEGQVEKDKSIFFVIEAHAK